jgi:hypothetical protein
MMSDIGHKIIDGIISGALFHAYDPEHPDRPILVVWSSGAAEQIEAIVELSPLRDGGRRLQ